MTGRYQVDVWYSVQVDADSFGDARRQAIEHVRATVDQPEHVEVVDTELREKVES